MAISAARPNIVTLQILHTNDVHSHVEMMPYIATAMKQAQARFPDSTLIVDAGDQLEGTVAGDLDHGAPMADLMGAMGYQFVTRGNHDWKWGLSALNEWDAKSKAHVVLANVHNADGTLLPNTHAFDVAKVSGLSIGILGLLTTDTKNVASNEAMAGAQFDDEAQTLSKYEPQLHTDVEMVLDHCGKAADEKLAAYHAAHGPLFFVGGHSHDTIAQPDVVQGNPIVQAGCFGTELGALEIDFDTAQHKVVGYRHEIIPIDPKSMQADPQIASMVAKYQAQADAKMSNVVTTLPSTLTRSGQHDSPLGNMVTDAMRQAVGGADIAVINSDGLRADLPAGPVNLQQVYDVFPFECNLLKGSLKGSDIQAAMEHSVSFRPSPDNWHASTLQVSGMTVHYDNSRPAGQRVKSIEVNGQPLDPDKSYTVAMRDYLAEGKLGYTTFANANYQPAHVSLFDAMQNYLAHPGAPITAPTGRIVDETPKA